MDELQKYDKPPHEKRPTACVPREATKKTVRSSAQFPNAGILVHSCRMLESRAGTEPKACRSSSLTVLGKQNSEPL